MRTIECKDRERVLREQEPAALEALRQHAESCAACAQELELWNEISASARQMHKSWESPHLWPRIRQALAEEGQAASLPQRAWNWPQLWRNWQAVAAVVVLVLFTVAGAGLLLRRPAAPPQKAQLPPEVERRLLTEQAVREAQKAEAAHLASLEKLSALAEPKIQQPRTPLLASYREKLLLLDAAIAECRAQLEQNRANPQLRQELLAMYREKQRTLEQLIREE